MTNSNKESGRNPLEEIIIDTPIEADRPLDYRDFADPTIIQESPDQRITQEVPRLQLSNNPFNEKTQEVLLPSEEPIAFPSNYDEGLKTRLDSILKAAKSGNLEIVDHLIEQVERYVEGRPELQGQVTEENTHTIRYYAARNAAKDALNSNNTKQLHSALGYIKRSIIAHPGLYTEKIQGQVEKLYAEALSLNISLLEKIPPAERVGAVAVQARIEEYSKYLQVEKQVYKDLLKLMPQNLSPELEAYLEDSSDEFK